MMFVFALLFSTRCDGGNPDSEARPDLFAFAFWKHECAKTLNILFSPYSFFRALAVCAVELKPRFREIALSTLRFPNPKASVDEFALIVRDVASHMNSSGSFVLRDVNAIWINSASGISESRFNASRDQLFVDVSQLTFPKPATKIINKYIETATDGLIQDFVGELSPDIGFLITNALYLHGQWVTPFETSLTSDRPFKLFNGQSITVPLMSGEFDVPYRENDDAQIVFLPYRDSECEFVVILPRDPSEAGFRRAMMNFAPDWLRPSSFNPLIKLKLPRFKVQSQTRSLEKIAADLGLREALETREAIFPQPDEEPRLFISQILQQVVVEVDEEGTKAAAVTMIEADLETSEPDPPQVVEVNADRAFAYAIQNRVTGTILFMGTYLNPAEA
jgi:serpin B